MSRALLALVALSVVACTRAAPVDAVTGNGRDSGPLIDTFDATPSLAPVDLPLARSKLKHLIFIMQENRSFDHYFGTFPGADGIPIRNNVPTLCVPDPRAKTCVLPYHNTTDINGGARHSPEAAALDVNGGKMDGFIISAEASVRGCAGNENNPVCMQRGPIDVMGYHDEREIPNYWAYAKNFVLQDHMFAPTASWSLPAHLYMVSGWSASCASADPMSCATDISINLPTGIDTHRAWTDITFLLDAQGVNWKYYLGEGTEPDCQDDAGECPPVAQLATVPGIWNPLPLFDSVHFERHDGYKIVPLEQFYKDVHAGTLPPVSWIVPTDEVSEHPPQSVHMGESYVTGLVNTIMQSPNWQDSAIFISWDDWGGFYDHVAPPKIDKAGYGIRVPGLVVSPYAKQGYIDHQVLSFDAYLKLIEDVFLNGARLDPKTDGRPDSRPNVRENAAVLGDLLRAFDFDQSPRAPLVLP